MCCTTGSSERGACVSEYYATWVKRERTPRNRLSERARERQSGERVVFAGKGGLERGRKAVGLRYWLCGSPNREGEEMTH